MPQNLACKGNKSVLSSCDELGWDILTYPRSGVILSSTVHTLVCLGLADDVSAPFEAIAELGDDLTGGEVGEDLRAAFELRELIDQLPGLENVLAGGEL